MSKKYIVVTGGAGFVGSNLIKRLIKNKKIIILSLDNYSSGKISNHIRSSRVKYIKGDIRNINKIMIFANIHHRACMDQKKNDHHE